MHGSLPRRCERVSETSADAAPSVVTSMTDMVGMPGASGCAERAHGLFRIGTHVQGAICMGKNLGRAILAALILLCWAPVDDAFGEPTEMDQKILRLAQADPAAGMVFMEVKFFADGRTTPERCQRISVTVVSDQGKSGEFVTQRTPAFLGYASDDPTYGGAAVLPAGIYTVTSISCVGSSRFPGRFARFAVQTSQVLNLGCLVIEYKHAPLSLLPTRPSGHWHVTDLSPDAVASLSRLAPVAFSKATKRYMTPVLSR
jgi:hypothetical protein